MKLMLKIFALVAISALSFFIDWNFSPIILTIYTVMGIMFSVGMGLIVSFNYQGIRNQKFLLKIRKDLNKSRNNFITLFTISTFLYIVSEIIGERVVIHLNNSTHFNTSFIIGIFIIYSIMYFIVNFIHIQKLGYDIFDFLNKQPQ